MEDRKNKEAMQKPVMKIFFMILFFEHFFLTVSYFKKHSLKTTDISSMKKTVFVNGFRCKIRAFIVSHHHIGSFYKNFSVFRNFYFYISDNRSYSSYFYTSGFRDKVNGNYRRCFSKTISFEH